MIGTKSITSFTFVGHKMSVSDALVELYLYLRDVPFELSRGLKGPHVFALHSPAAMGAWHFFPHGYSPFISACCQKTYR